MVNTCGVCEIIVDENEMLQHSCLENYNRVHIDNNRYFYPVCGKTSKDFITYCEVIIFNGYVIYT